MKLVMVKTSTLLIDPRYQRQLDMRRVTRTAKAFNLGAMKAISVCRRPDGRLFVYDGMHTIAAAQAAGLAKVPAVIVDGTRELEAQWFLMINGGSAKRVSQRDIQRAGVIAGDELSMLAQDVLTYYSLEISGGGHRQGHTNAIGAIKRYIKISPDALKIAMDAIYELWREDPRAWNCVLLRGMFEIARLDGVMRHVVVACKRKKLRPYLITSMASSMQAASGAPGGGPGHSRAAILSLCGIKLGAD